jgi:hypothetical protein
MRDLIPELSKKRRQNLSEILSFAMRVNPPDKELFLNTINGMTDDELSSNEKIANLVIEGLKQFGETNRADRIKDMQKSHN